MSGLRWAVSREETALTKKLQVLAGQIGNFGLGAALLSFAAMSGHFTLEHLSQGTWQASYATSYLHFFVTSITILVSFVPPWTLDCRAQLLSVLVHEILERSNTIFDVSLSFNTGNGMLRRW